MKVTLKPHVGTHLATRQQVDLGQDEIYVDGEHYGYVVRKPGSPINLIKPRVPDNVRAAIADAVSAKLGRASRIAMPLDIQIPTDTGEDLDD